MQEAMLEKCKETSDLKTSSPKVRNHESFYLIWCMKFCNSLYIYATFFCVLDYDSVSTSSLRNLYVDISACN